MKIPNDIATIIDKYEYDQSIRKHANKYYFHNNAVFCDVKSMDDVSRYSQQVRVKIDCLKEIYPLYDEELLKLEKALGRYEDAIKKVLQCYSHVEFGFNYTANELLELINLISKYEDEIADLYTRKMCQD